MKTLTGIPAAPGLAFGKALLYLENDFPEIPRYTVCPENLEHEWERFQSAVGEAAGEVRSRLETESENKEYLGILKVHLMMIEDPDFHGRVKARLEERRENIEWVVKDTAAVLVRMLMASMDASLRERAVDIADMSNQVLYKLLAIKRTSLASLPDEVVLVTHDLLPSQALTLDRGRVKALLLDVGSKTSHIAILARSFGIPAVLGLASITKEVTTGLPLIVNGDSGEVTVDPPQQEIRRHKKSLAERRKCAAALDELRELPAETTDGARFTLKANIETPEDVEKVLFYGAEGVGLYRSEFLFLTPGRPTEEDFQTAAYRKVVEELAPLPVTIRTSDVGGDKILPGFYNLDEKNPLLGWRAIRFSLASPELFQAQLRAILRASAFGKARVLLPMISGLDELEQSLAALEEAKDSCRKRGLPFDEAIEAGVMIEVPSAALVADCLAEKAAFFSLGTNDLLQYTLAIDRGNAHVNYLARPEHPAVLRLIKNTIDAAHNAGIQACMCGEMAGDPAFAPLLAGLGLDVFSMTSASIPLVKREIRSTSLSRCRELADAALSCCRPDEVQELLASYKAGED